MSGGEQQFCLKWNNYSVSVTSVFKELLENQQMCDVTLSTQEKNIKAHRIVLTACSTFFKNIFQDVNQWQQPIIFLKDMKYEDLRGIIEFIYNGEVSIDQGSLPSFLLAAESLKIKGLTEESQRSESSSNTNSKTINNETIFRLNEVAEGALEGKMSTKEEEEEEEMKLEDDEEEEEEELTEQEMKNSSLDSITDEKQKFDGEEMFLKEQGGLYLDPSLVHDPNLALYPALNNPALLGAKKTCPYCFQQLSWHALSRHIRDMHKAKADLVNCQYCLKTFRNKNSLGCHIWRFHKRGREPKATFAETKATFGEPKPDTTPTLS